MDLKSVKIMLNMNNIQTLNQIFCVLTVIYFGKVYALNCPGTEYIHGILGYKPDSDACKTRIAASWTSCQNSVDNISVIAAVPDLSGNCDQYTCPVTLVPAFALTYMLLCPEVVEVTTTSVVEVTTTSVVEVTTTSVEEVTSSSVVEMTTQSGDEECDCSLLNVPTGVEAPRCSVVLPGEMPEYNCSEHYLESSPATTICQDDGTWLENPPTCYQAPCADPPAPVNGTVSADGEKANYTCDADFKRKGPPFRLCKWKPAKGPVWNGNDPTCDLIECPIEIDVLNGGAVVNLTSVDSEAYYYCDEGFIMNGANITVCLIYGNWSESPPFCQPTMCPTPSNPVNGVVAVAGGTAPGNVAEYSCSSGYILSNSTPVVCNSNFTWSPEPPVCVREAPPLLYIRSCLCSTSNEFANKTQDEIIAHLIAETAINTQNTSLARSKLESSNDPRTSSRIIGTVAIIFMSVIGAFMALIDLLSVCQKLERWNKVKTVDTDES